MRASSVSEQDSHIPLGRWTFLRWLSRWWRGQDESGSPSFSIMPVTAAERLLHDPFDPVQALPKSAEFLRELRAQFGNLGLAAAAYNAGPQRVRDWLAGKRTLPSGTQTYVRNVTGRSAQEWARPDQKALTLTIPSEMSCAQIQTAKLVAKPPTPAVVPKPMSDWGVQLVGDRSEIKALMVYRQLQKKHEAILGGYEPVVIRTTVKVSAAPIWNRVRIDADSREAAQMLCSRLRSVGENCLVQRN
jgi:Transglycosylase SLT domain/SPOR domain